MLKSRRDSIESELTQRVTSLGADVEIKTACGFSPIIHLLVPAGTCLHKNTHAVIKNLFEFSFKAACDFRTEDIENNAVVGMIVQLYKEECFEDLNMTEALQIMNQSIYVVD